MYLFFLVAKMQVTVVTSLSEEYRHCYKLYQIIHTTHSFLSALYMLQNVLIVLPFMSCNSIFSLFTLNKDGVNIIVYMTCLYLLLKKKK